MEIDEQAYSSLSVELASPIRMLFTSIFFVNQSWVATPVFLNLPYWSLGYEVLYYVFFGILIYSNNSIRIVLLTCVIVIMGPSILLYLPIWLAGALCYKVSQRFRTPLYAAIAIYFLSILGIIIFSNSLFQKYINAFSFNFFGDTLFNLLLQPSEKFLVDYILTLFISMNIYGAYNILLRLEVFGEIFGRFVQKISSHTFSLYLLHMPFMYFFYIIFPFSSSPIQNILSIWVVTPGLVLIVSHFIEKNRYVYKREFNAGLEKIVEILSIGRVHK